MATGTYANGNFVSDTAASAAMDDLVGAIHHCLSDVQTDGSFAVFSPLDNAPNPGIYLQNGGVVGLPLSERDAHAIVAASHEAPFGKGEQTIIDKSVRKTWELSPDDFELRNPAWMSFIRSTVTAVGVGLGIGACGRGVSAQLYKMLLYDEGALFKPHQDSEKVPGMFGTLVIVLPSKHEGGEVRVTHAGETKLFESSIHSEFGTSYAAWFSDVTHEVKPVLSGHRLVLTYNLVHTTLGPQQLSAGGEGSLLQLRATFSKWKDGLQQAHWRRAVAYQLEHQYTEASLRFDSLKGKDMQTGSLLKQVCEEYGFSFYLANFEKTVEGGCDEDEETDEDGMHPITEECDTSATLKKVVELDGTEIASDLEFGEKNFTTEFPFEDITPDDEEYSGYTGNEGVSATHFYRRTVALIMPKDYRVEFFLDPARTVPNRSIYGFYGQPEPEPEKSLLLVWHDRFVYELVTNPSDDSAREYLEAVCRMVPRQLKSWRLKTSHWHQIPADYDYGPPKDYQSSKAPFSERIVEQILCTTLEILDSKELFSEAFSIWPEKVTPQMFEQSGIAWVRYDLSLGDKLSMRLAKIESLNDRFEIIKTIELGITSESKRSSKDITTQEEWIKSQIVIALVDSKMKTARDGNTLSMIAQRLPPQDTFQSTLPAVKRQITYTPMALAFLCGLFAACSTGVMAMDIAHKVFRDVISDLAKYFNLKVEDLLKATKPGLDNPYIRSASLKGNEEIDRQNILNITQVMSICLDLGLDEFDEICTKLTANVKASHIKWSHIDVFESFYIPLLKELYSIVQGKAAPPPLQTLFQETLSKYIVEFVRAEPPSAKNFTRPRIPCTYKNRCRGCDDLNRFLINPNQKESRFIVSRQLAGHLGRQLQGKPDLSHSTRRESNTQESLTITKTNTTYVSEHNKWAERFAVAKAHIRSMLVTDEITLRGLLGHKFDMIQSLSVPALVADMSSRHDPLAASRNASNSRVLPPITKRKISASAAASSGMIPTRKLL